MFNRVLNTPRKLVLTLSWRRSLSDKNQPIDLQSKSIDWFLHDRDLHHERVNNVDYLTYFLKFFLLEVAIQGFHEKQLI